MFSAVVLALCLSFVCLSHQESLPLFTDILSSQKNLSSFSDILNRTYPDLLTRIGSQTNITILAPSNAAFAKTVYYPIIGPAFSQNDVGAIRAILDYHIVIGDHPSSSLLPTFQYFPTWLSNTSFTNVTGGQRAGGVLQSGTDMIWTSGESNRSPAIETDIVFEGGTVHIIDSLMIPPSSFPATAESFSTAAEPYELTSFLGAVYFTPNGTTSIIATLLNETSDITIFAPNNVAMESVASSLTSMSTSNTSAVFQELLKYHIIIGKGGPWYSTLFPKNGTTLETLNGDTIIISFLSNSFFINSARVLTSDLLLANGIMHVLDNVVSPDKPSSLPNPNFPTQIPVLSTGGGFDVSTAPFTTSLPDAVITHPTTAAGTSTSGGGNQATATVGSPGTTGTAKSGGMRNRLNEGFWSILYSLIFIHGLDNYVSFDFNGL